MKRDRMRRVDELMRRELGTLIERTVSSEVTALVTVTGVKTSSDLRHAILSVSIMGDEAARQSALRALQRRRVEFQHEIGQRIQMKYTPVLRIELDTSPERADRVISILDDLGLPDTPEADAGDGQAGDGPA